MLVFQSVDPRLGCHDLSAPILAPPVMTIRIAIARTARTLIQSPIAAKAIQAATGPIMVQVPASQRALSSPIRTCMCLRAKKSPYIGSCLRLDARCRIRTRPSGYMPMRPTTGKASRRKALMCCQARGRYKLRCHEPRATLCYGLRKMVRGCL